jgi:hypothetical protein
MVAIGAACATAIVAWQLVDTGLLGHGHAGARHGTPVLWTAVGLYVLAAGWLVRLALRLHRGRPGTTRKAVISSALLVVLFAIPPYSWLNAVPLIALVVTGVFALAAWALNERERASNAETNRAGSE